MDNSVMDQIEKVLKDLGGFTFEQAEIWAGFCDAVGMDAVPFMKVMLEGICDVKTVTGKQQVPSKVRFPELWIIPKGFRTKIQLVEP